MIKTNIENLENELLDIVKIFYPVDYEKIDIEHTFMEEGGGYTDFFNICRVEYCIKHKNAKYYAKYSSFRVLKRVIKADLYKILSKINRKKSLWGSLTGIRPVKLYKDTLSEFGSKTDKFFKEFFDVSKEKLALVKNIAKVQQALPVLNKNDCDIYIGIPFCNGKCNYCSFVSADINKNGELVEPYISALVDEITALKELMGRKRFNVRAVYIGGGTPSSFPVKSLKKILEALSGFNPVEYTFEAGRPDSINKELLDLLKEFGINRISINPQTANDRILKLIGRGHDFADVLNAFKLSKNYNFIINMDIIAGLEGEDLKDFKNTLNEVAGLNPDNITVHTLCLKKGSLVKIDLEKQKNVSKSLKVSGGLKNSSVRGESENIGNKDNPLRVRKPLNLMDCKSDTVIEEGVVRMLSFAYKSLKKSGYEPYYLYRQKYSVNNLENAGFCKEGKMCLYNIDNMDDTASVLACGANAISKRIYDGGRIERYANPKDIKTYIEKIAVINEMKDKLFE